MASTPPPVYLGPAFEFPAWCSILMSPSLWCTALLICSQIHFSPFLHSVLYYMGWPILTRFSRLCGPLTFIWDQLTWDRVGLLEDRTGGARVLCPSHSAQGGCHPVCDQSSPWGALVMVLQPLPPGGLNSSAQVTTFPFVPPALGGGEGLLLLRLCPLLTIRLSRPSAFREWVPSTTVLLLRCLLGDALTLSGLSLMW